MYNERFGFILASYLEALNDLKNKFFVLFYVMLTVVILEFSSPLPNWILFLKSMNRLIF